MLLKSAVLPLPKSLSTVAISGLLFAVSAFAQQSTAAPKVASKTANAAKTFLIISISFWYSSSGINPEPAKRFVLHPEPRLERFFLYPEPAQAGEGSL